MNSAPAINRPAHVLFASLVGTTIEFFDFYIYATAAVLVFPKLFFPASDTNSATLQSFATFAIAFYARPIGSALFGHFGDRVGRKTTLVAALATMGLSTFAIGALPDYAHIGLAAPLLLALCRFGQGLGWGGPAGRRECPARPPCPLRHLSATGSTDRVPALGRHFSAAVGEPDQCPVLEFRLAHSVPSQRRAGHRRPVCTSEDQRDTGIPSGAR
jgi:MFS family permease